MPATPDAPNFKLYGPILPEEANQLVSASNPNTDPFVQALRQRVGMHVGDTIGDQQLSLGLVVEKGEDGIDKPVSYVNLGNYDLGTKVNRAEDEERKGTPGLPELSTAWEMLQAREAAKKSSETSDHEPSQFDAIASQPDTILKPENLDFFAQPGKIYDAITDAQKAEDHDQAELIANIRDSAARSIFGPEKSAQQAREMTQKLAEQMADELRMLDMAYDQVSQRVNTANQVLEPMRERVPAMMNLLGNARGKLQETGKLDEHDYQQLLVIQDFVQGYRPMLAAATESEHDEQQGAMYASQTADQLREDANSGRGRIARDAEESMYPDPNADYSETIPAIIERGAGSISNHYNACDNEKVTLDGAAAELVLRLDDLYGLNGNLLNVMRNREETTSKEMVHPYNLDVAIDGMMRFVRAHAYGEPYSPQAVLQTIDDALETIQKIGFGIQKRDQASSDISAALHMAKSLNEQLKQLPLFATNR